MEILYGKGSGQLLKKVERFLQQPHIKETIPPDRNDGKEFWKNNCVF